MWLLRDLRARLAGLQDETRRARDEPGPLSAREAWALAEPVALAWDPGVRLVGIRSDLNISHEGLAYEWEFSLDLPRYGRRAVYTVAPGGGDPEEAPLLLTCRYLDGGEPRRALPAHWMDSPEAVRLLTEAGVDFVAGPTDMSLATAWEVAQGEGYQAAWVTEDFAGTRSVILG